LLIAGLGVLAILSAIVVYLPPEVLIPRDMSF
jgi:hypothetical protein